MQADSPLQRRSSRAVPRAAPLRRRPKQLDAEPQLLEASRGGAGGLVLGSQNGRAAGAPGPGSGGPASTAEQGTLTGPEADERVRTAAATVGALAAELSRDDLAVVAFWSDAAILSRIGQHVPPQSLLDRMLRIPARGLTNIAFPLQVAARELARVPARDARAVLLSDCVHNAGPDPRPFAARLPRLDVLLDTSGEQDADLARELARRGRGRLRRIDLYTDVAPALSAIFAP